MSPSSSQPLPLLADRGSYIACRLDLGTDELRRAYWLDLFRGHFPILLEEALREGASRGEDEQPLQNRCTQAREVFDAYLDDITQDPQRYGRLDILTICAYREGVLRRFGFDDPYRLAKRTENDVAMKLLESVLKELDALSEADRVVRLIEGVFAGNIFDLGVKATLDLYKSGSLDFHATRRRLKPRPWLIDDLDRWVDRVMDGPAHRCAVLFVDNAGCDIVLGMIPFARWLLGRGTGVVMTANTSPSLNDITHAELTQLIEKIATWDDTIGDALADGRLELVPSGNATPLIDLSRCSPALVEAVVRQEVDLVVLEGMGRALESNFDVPFVCDVMKIAMIKDEGVAEVFNGEVYDLVFRFDPAVPLSLPRQMRRHRPT